MESVATNYTAASIEAQLTAGAQETANEIRADLEGLNTINLDELIEKHGTENITNALSNLITQQVGETIKNRLAERDDIPQAVKDKTNADIDAGVASQHKPTTSEAQADIDAIFSQAIINGMEAAVDDEDKAKQHNTGSANASANSTGSGESSDTIAESDATGESEGVEAANDSDATDATDAVDEEVADAAGESVSGTGNSGDSWMIALARVFGKLAGEHLKNALTYASEISSINSGGGGDMSKEDKAALTAEKQALFQAEMQQFKMAMEMTTTGLKTMGESMSGMARKQ